MRMSLMLLSFLVAGVPGFARGQSFVVQGSAGPTLSDRGYSLAGGAGWSPWSRVIVSVNVDRIHLASRLTTDARGFTSGFRGSTLTLGTAELQVSLFARDRVTPYVLAGYAAGVSRPTVNGTFPDRVTNEVYAVFAGAGLQVPLQRRLSVFADARMLLGGEANETLVVTPLRVGMSWRF